MKISTTVMLSVVLLLGVNLAVAQNNHIWYPSGTYPNGTYNGQTTQAGNADYQRGLQDGVNSGRADSNQNKPFNVESHPYYRNSNNQAYRSGFMQGYREAYQGGGNSGRYGNGGYGPYGNGGPYNNGGYGPYGNTGPNNGGYGNNNAYENGVRDGINSGRADANSNRRPSAESHPYYRNSGNEAYRDGFMKGYREGYRETNGNNGHNNGNYNGAYNGGYNHDHDWEH